jgi:hypothetical protein
VVDGWIFIAVRGGNQSRSAPGGHLGRTLSEIPTYIVDEWVERFTLSTLGMSVTPRAQQRRFIRLVRNAEIVATVKR